MSLSFEKLRALKKNKEKYYADAIKNEAPPLYGMGKEYRLKNTESDRGKRRYGFKRQSIRQKHRIKKSALERGKRSSNRSFETILRTTEVNDYYDDCDMHNCYSYIYSCYSDHKIFVDHDCANDIYVTRVKHLIGNDEGRAIFLYENYLEIFHEAFIRFMVSIDNYNESNGASFYTYVINVLPYIFSTTFNKAWKINSIALETVELEDSIEDLYTPINPLGVFIRIHNMSKIEKRIYVNGK